MKSRNALIAGSTGLIGSFLLEKLLTDERYEKVYIITRRPLNLDNEKAREIITDFDHIRNDLNNIGAEDVYCCLGTTMNKAGSKEAFKKVDLYYPLAIAEIMRENGAQKMLIVTAMGANRRSLFFYNRVKGEVEESLKRLDYPSLIIFRPSLLLGERGESRVGEDIAKKVYKYLDRIFVGPFKKYRAIHGETVASAMIKMSKKETDGVLILESDEIREA